MIPRQASAFAYGSDYRALSVRHGDAHQVAFRLIAGNEKGHTVQHQVAGFLEFRSFCGIGDRLAAAAALDAKNDSGFIRRVKGAALVNCEIGETSRGLIECRAGRVDRALAFAVEAANLLFIGYVEPILEADHAAWIVQAIGKERWLAVDDDEDFAVAIFAHFARVADVKPAIGTRHDRTGVLDLTLERNRTGRHLGGSRHGASTKVNSQPPTNKTALS